MNKKTTDRLKFICLMTSISVILFIARLMLSVTINQPMMPMDKCIFRSVIGGIVIAILIDIHNHIKNNNDDNQPPAPNDSLIVGA